VEKFSNKDQKTIFTVAGYKLVWENLKKRFLSVVFEIKDDILFI